MKNQKGITLIALVITIIVLLILAGVAISMVIGDNGIITQATNAEGATIEGTEQEQVTLAFLAAKTKNLGGSVTLDDFQAALNDNLVEARVEVDSNNSKIFIVIFTKTGNKYTVDKEIVKSEGKTEVTPGETTNPDEDTTENIDSEEKQIVELAYYAAKIKVYTGEKTSITAQDIQNELADAGVTNVIVTTNEDKIIVTFSNGNKYTIESSGTIIADSNNQYEEKPEEGNSPEEIVERERQSVELAYLSLQIKVYTGEKTSITAQDIKNELILMGDTGVEVTSNGNEIIVTYPSGNKYVIQNDTVTKQ